MIATPVPRRRSRTGLLALWVTALAGVSACAADPDALPPDGGAMADAAPDVVADVVPDRPSDVLADGPADGFAPGPDGGPGQVEPPLVVRTCGGTGDMGGTCCPSVLDFEDGTTEHFLTPGCCRMALSSPQVVMTPAACGHGALKLDADFRATDADSLCGTPGELAACAYTSGEVTRAVLAPLNLTGRTASVMVFLQGPALPAAPVHGRLFVVGRTGLVEGPQQTLDRTDAWMPIALGLPDDGTGSGADIQILGVRVDFHGQAWAGRVFLDELTWH